EAVSAEAISVSQAPVEFVPAMQARGSDPQPANVVGMHTGGKSHPTPVFLRDELQPGDEVKGPAIIAEANATTVVEPGWQAAITELNHLLMTRVEARPAR